jgi:hypothetical protein
MRLASLVAAGMASSPSVHAETVRVAPGEPLGRAVALATPGTVIELTAGEHHLSPHPFVEPDCGNCEEPLTSVTATVGVLVRGRNLTIRGAGAEETIVHTNAGYGLLFDGCESCVLSDLTLTGGVRDPDDRATNAAVVVKHGTVEIARCVIRDNIGHPEVVGDVVVGIMGIAVRAGGEIWAHDNRIRRNSWDGIAAYRGAIASIQNNVIDGVDRARGTEVGGGRGVGIGLTWDAYAVVEGNLVRNYWKGIGIFVDARGEVRWNVVEHVLTWGISLWDAGKGRPVGTIAENAIFDTGACGIAVVRADETDDFPGVVLDNALVRTGQDPRYDSGEPYCEQTAIARHAVPEALAIEGNLFHDNREPGGSPGPDDVDATAFAEATFALVTALTRWSALNGSDFLVTYGR